MKRLLPLLLCGSLFLIHGCNTTPDPVLTVSPENLAFSAEGGAQTVQVKANNPWTASASGSGISVNPSSGDGDATVTVTASATSSTNPVSGTVTFRSEGLAATVSVTQDERKVIQVGDVMVIPAEGGTFAVDIQYNTDYTVEVDASAKSWISFLGTRALQSGKLEFQFAENGNTEPRQGTVTVKDKAGKVSDITLKFVQEEKKVISVVDVMTIPAEGGTFAVDIQYNTDFDVIVESEAQSWITFVATRALKSGKLEFRFAENQNTSARLGAVFIKAKSGKVSTITLNFNQKGKTVILSVGDVSTIPAEGGTFMVDIQYNTDFDVVVEAGAQSWITFVATRSLQSGKLEFRFEANPNTDPRQGTVTVKDKSGKVSDITLTFKQLANKNMLLARSIMEKVYEAWGAKNWNEPWIPGETWPGLTYDEDRNKVSLRLKGVGIKGGIPECIGELGDLIWDFVITDEPDLTGSLPMSFASLTALEVFGINRTSIQNIPDIFAGMPLEGVSIYSNEQLFCPLPYSIGDSPKLRELYLHNNCFTGHLPASWARLGEKFTIYNNCLTGTIPREYLDSGLSVLEILDKFGQQRGYGLDVTEIDFRAEWDRCFPKNVVTDLEGNKFTCDEIIKKNKLTVYLNWAPWCPFSKDLMPQLKAYYEKYHKDGLEIIATVMFDDAGNPWNDLVGQKKEVAEKGYGQWYNFYWDPTIYTSYYMATPWASVYDSEGFVLFSHRWGFTDPVRKRLNRMSSTELIPFLETVFGPAEEQNDYTSTDYSMDGQVLTLQKASAGKGINIVFMGDGYTDKDMASGGLYETVMRQSMEEFFAIEPYNTFRNRFNVYAVKAVSKNGWIGEGYTTALGTAFVGGQAVRGNDGKCYEYALKVPGITGKENLLVCVMLNTKKHAGTAAMSESLQSSVAYVSTYGNDSKLFGSTLRHEAGGHGFAFLADEYVNYDIIAPDDHIAHYNDVFTKYGWFSNVDFTDDPAKIRWSAFLNDNRYKDEIGIFRGGALYGKGVWRPSQNSMMNMNFEYFNAPSRWAIYKRIMGLSGESYSFDKFLEYDAVNRGKKQSSAPRTRSNVKWEPTAPPVIVP